MLNRMGINKLLASVSCRKANFRSNLNAMNQTIILLGVWVAIVALFLGSFIGMASWRWLRKETWGGRSRCPVCGRQLGAWI